MSASPNLKCGLCHDYLVNAVTVAGCMHSFCEECLLKNLSISGICPTKGCKKNVDKNGYRRDSTLQMLVYKFMPRIFFENAEKDKAAANSGNKKAQRELVQATTEICDPEELLSICLEFVPAPANIAKTDEDTVSARPSTSASSQNEPPAKKPKKSREQREVQQTFRRFFRCAAKVPIRTIRRLLETKLFLTDQFGVHFISDRDFQDISDDVTLRTLVLDGGFDRTRPFRLFFTLVPTVVDDAPPVLDAETMPCLMPEAPVHQETPPTVQPSAPIQPVQIVSPVVPALTVSLSTDIYGHSAPIITQQCAPRKRRKLSDPKRSPTEKSPTTSAAAAPPQHPTPIAPNMLVGQLLRPMFITQPPFLHRSPPNMHISMPFNQPPQMSATMEGPPMKKPGPSYECDTSDRPPRLHREDPVAMQVPPAPPAPPKPPPTTPVSSAQQQNSHPPLNCHSSPIPSVAEPSPKLPRLDPPQPMPQPMSAPPVRHTVASVLGDQKVASKSRQEPSSTTSAKMPRASNSQRSQQSGQKSNGETKRATKVEPLSTPSSSKDPPSKTTQPLPASRVEPQASGPKQSQSASKVEPQVPSSKQPLSASKVEPQVPSSKQPLPASRVESQASSPNKVQSRPVVQENGACNGISASEQKPSPVTPLLPPPHVSENPRPVQPVLPQLLTTTEVRTTSATSEPVQTPPVNTATSSVSSSVKPTQNEPAAVKSENPTAVAEPVASAPAASAPMDFRRMATLNKQSLGRTLHAVLTSGRAANADASKNTNGSGGTSMDVRPAPLNGKINKDAGVDLHFPSSKSLST